MRTIKESPPREKTTGAPRGAPVVFSGAEDILLDVPPNEAGTPEKFVVFFLNNRCYGVSARAVVEVSRPLPIAVLPHSRAWLAGVANLRGEIVPVLDAAKILNDPAAKNSSAAKFIILRARCFDSPVALPVDRVKEIVKFGEKDFQPAARESAIFIFAAVAYQTTFLHLIDADAMLASVVLD